MKYSPMLCKLVDKPFKDKGWEFECKIDGMRIIAIKDRTRVRLLTRNNIDKARQFPEIVAAMKKLKSSRLVLDGEIVAFRKGISNFQAIQPRIGQTNAVEIAKLIETNPVSYLAFDLLNWEGKNWETKPLLERKQKLKVILKPIPPYTPRAIYYLAPLTSNGIALFKKAKEKHWEGIVGKKIDSRYQEGKRGNTWVKIKTHNQQEFVIGAFTPGQGKTKNTFGAILIGYYQKGKLIYAGKVGTGFTEDERKDLKKRFGAIKAVRSPFGQELNEKNAVWLKPRLVGEFAFGEWTKDNILRQPVYMGLRIDKSPKSVIKEN